MVSGLIGLAAMIVVFISSIFVLIPSTITVVILGIKGRIKPAIAGISAIIMTILAIVAYTSLMRLLEMMSGY